MIRPLTAAAFLGLLAFATVLPAARADPIDDGIAQALGPADGLQDYRSYTSYLCTKCHVANALDVPQQDTPGQDVPDWQGSDPIATPDYPGSGPQPLPDYQGSPPGPTVALGGLRVYDKASGELCTGITVTGVTTGEQTLFCYQPGGLDGPILANVPRGVTPLGATVPGTDPVETPDDLGGTDPQQVPDGPSTPPVTTPDVPSEPVGPVHVPKYEVSVLYRAYYDCSAIAHELNVLGQAQTYRPFDVSSPAGLQWAKAHADQLGVRVFVYLYADGVEVDHTSVEIPLLGQFMATYGETADQGAWPGCA